MRIALTHPWTWPHVQRGGERLFADLAWWLTGAGHDVVRITAGPAPGRRTDAGGSVVERRVPDHRLLRRVDLDQAVTYLPGVARTLRSGRFDIVHGLHHLDGLAARVAHQGPYIVHLQGMPVRASLAHRPVHRRLLPASLRNAAAVLTVSHAAAEAAAEEFGIAAVAVHNGIRTEDFAAAAATPRAERPTVLFPGDPHDARKRLLVLVDSIRTLRASWPDLRLAVAAPVRAELAATMRSTLGTGIDFLGLRSPADMPAAYGRAWVTCLPAVREAFGLVVVESLAAGTPAVAVRDGGVPEVLREARWLAEPDDVDDLALALDRALRDSCADGVAGRCVALAAPFDWAERGPQFEQVYRDAVG